MDTRNTAEPALRSSLEARWTTINASEPALRSPLSLQKTGGKLSPPSEPFGLRLPLRTRLISSIFSASGRGIGVRKDDALSTRPLVNAKSPWPRAQLQVTRPQNWGRVDDEVVGVGASVVDRDRLRATATMRPARFAAPRGVSRRPQSGLRAGGRLPPFRCGSRGDDAVGSDVFCGSRRDDAVGSDVFAISRKRVERTISRRQKFTSSCVRNRVDTSRASSRSSGALCSTPTSVCQRMCPPSTKTLTPTKASCCRAPSRPDDTTA
jgi:hypothetical protein